MLFYGFRVKINLLKSKLIILGVPFSQVSRVADKIGCDVTELLFIHLGVPLG